MYQLFHTSVLPMHWIVDDGREKWMVPAHHNGWAARRPYHGVYTLTESTLAETRVVLSDLGVPAEGR